MEKYTIHQEDNKTLLTINCSPSELSQVFAQFRADNNTSKYVVRQILGSTNSSTNSSTPTNVVFTFELDEDSSGRRKQEIMLLPQTDTPVTEDSFSDIFKNGKHDEYSILPPLKNILIHSDNTLGSIVVYEKDEEIVKCKGMRSCSTWAR